MTAKIFSPRRTQRAQRKNLCVLCALCGAVLVAAKAALRACRRINQLAADCVRRIQFRPQQDNENGAFGQDKYQKIALDFSEKFVYLLTHFGRMDIAGYTHHCIEGRAWEILELGLTNHILE